MVALYCIEGKELIYLTPCVVASPKGLSLPLLLYKYLAVCSVHSADSVPCYRGCGSGAVTLLCHPGPLCGSKRAFVATFCSACIVCPSKMLWSECDVSHSSACKNHAVPPCSGLLSWGHQSLRTFQGFIQGTTPHHWSILKTYYSRVHSTRLSGHSC